MLSSYQTKRRSIGGLSCLRCPVTTTTTGQTVPPDSPPSRPPFSFPCSLILPSSFIPNHTWYSCHCRSVCLDRHLHPPVAIPRSPLPHTPHAITAFNTINSHGTWQPQCQLEATSLAGGRRIVRMASGTSSTLYPLFVDCRGEPRGSLVWLDPLNSGPSSAHPIPLLVSMVH